ncbi:hypothetical protein F0U59_27880 [Archangium gephyra]|nr:hypothetical protein F0U59_27880 [Archangium gephyra]
MDTPLSTRTALLTVLVQDRSFGLELIEKVRALTEGKIVLDEGSVYPALKALEREGLVRSFEGEPLTERGAGQGATTS